MTYTQIGFIISLTALLFIMLGAILGMFFNKFFDKYLNSDYVFAPPTIMVFIGFCFMVYDTISNMVHNLHH